MQMRILCLLLAILPCVAQPRGRGASGSVSDPLIPNYVSTVLTQYLSLSDGQITSINQAIGDSYSQRMAITLTIADLQTQLSKAATAQTPDPAQVGKLYLQIAAQQTALANVSTQLTSQLNGMLSSDQQAKVKALQDAQNLQSAICAAQTAGLLPSAALNTFMGVPAPSTTFLVGAAVFTSSCYYTAVVPTATMRNGDFSPSPAP